MPVRRYRPALAVTTALGALAVSLGLAHVFAAGWVGNLGLDVWNYSELAERFEQQDARRTDLETQGDSLWSQISASGDVIGELAEGRITLAAATTELESINRGRPGFTESLEALYRECPTHRDRVARWAIARVRQRLAQDPTRQTEATSRLGREYAAVVRAGAGDHAAD